MKPPSPSDLHDARISGDLSLVIGALALVSAFFTARLLESSPVWIFVVGLVLGTVCFWLAARAMKAPGGSRGRGTAAAGIVLSIIGIAFSAFGAAITSILNSDTPL